MRPVQAAVAAQQTTRARAGSRPDLGPSLDRSQVTQRSSGDAGPGLAVVRGLHQRFGAEALPRADLLTTLGRVRALQWLVDEGHVAVCFSRAIRALFRSTHAIMMKSSAVVMACAAAVVMACAAPRAWSEHFEAKMGI